MNVTRSQWKVNSDFSTWIATFKHAAKAINRSMHLADALYQTATSSSYDITYDITYYNLFFYCEQTI